MMIPLQNYFNTKIMPGVKNKIPTLSSQAFGSIYRPDLFLLPTLKNHVPLVLISVCPKIIEGPHFESVRSRSNLSLKGIPLGCEVAHSQNANSS